MFLYIANVNYFKIQMQIFFDFLKKLFRIQMELHADNVNGPVMIWFDTYMM